MRNITFRRMPDLLPQREFVLAVLEQKAILGGRPEVPADSISLLSMTAQYVKCIQISRYYMYECMNNCGLVNFWGANVWI